MGVKSLWSLLDPVGRPVLLETMEGKAMAIDSSIWIYQFQATMRDKEGRGLVNAHVLGFLRRICKLLFYGIKPVFVFDGGAPALKRATIAERKKKKSGAALSHVKVAERLLAAQLRREALNQVQGKTSKGKGKASDENVVYLEDIDDTAPKTPSKRKQDKPADPSSSKKSRWHDHDPYRLPEVNIDEMMSNATRSSAPDPRLATEDELRAFIEEMRPEDFDVTSPAFRELPTEVQYEVIGDLRLKSRQTSYKRLQNMLRNAKTPLDFSKEQIKNLKQRNSLTQQLLITTDSIGKANVSIPVRIASERNKEYLLIKNEGAEGGWVLGIRDDSGTRDKPIEIDRTSDKEEEEEDSDEDMEEVAIVAEVPFDADLRQHQREQALAALAERYTPKKLAPLTTKPQKKPRNVRPLFAPEGDELPVLPQVDDDEDPELTFAIAESLDHAEEADLRRAIEASRSQMAPPLSPTNVGASSSRMTLDEFKASSSEDASPRRGLSGHTPYEQDRDDDDLYASPNRLETALSIANASWSRKPLSQARHVSAESPLRHSIFGEPTLLIPSHLSSAQVPSVEPSDSEQDLEELPIIPSTREPSTTDQVEISRVDEDLAVEEQPATSAPLAVVSDSDDDMEEVLPVLSSGPASESHNSIVEQSEPTPRDIVEIANSDTPVTPPAISTSVSGESSEHPPEALHDSPKSTDEAPDHHNTSASDSEDDGVPWDAPPAPTTGPDGHPAPVESTADGWDAAEEMDPQAEEGEFARFLSQVKGKDLDTVRREIDEEIRELYQQKKAAMRDSEDVNQQMVSQIMLMLRLFGIPYITAPMEAEAQCAELLALGLVDGIITDDSDVFLFGGARVLKNMFNQSKTVECFLLPDLDRELGLDRDTLVRLAYLLGSDYTDGLPGVGPVVAMELLKEFPGQDGLHKFKHWWQKVQSGKDVSEESRTSFRKRFKKRFKDLYLPDEWPNPAVRDAYYHPTVDESEEPFKWGLPDLDALRSFFNSELGWHQTKVDELLLPIIRKMGKRGQSSALNRQGNLIGLFDVPLGTTHAPRKRQAYASKRLQQVVSDFRKERARLQSESTSTSAAEDKSGTPSDDEFSEKSAKRRKTSAGKGKNATRGAKSGAARGRGGKAARGRKKRASAKQQTSQSDEDNPEVPENGTGDDEPPLPLAAKLRPRPKPVYRGARATSSAPDEETDI